jgi:transposase InsO family protein
LPWKESCHVDERMKFVSRLMEGERMTDLCREFGISRKSGYKFRERYQRLSVIGLADASRAPGTIPHRTPPELVELVVAARRAHPTWGARKLREYLRVKQPEVRMPAASTIGEIVTRAGLVVPRRRRIWTPPSHTPLCKAEAPNELWCGDFKGQFRLGNRQYCYPLTISDALSRFLVACEGLDGTKVEPARQIFEYAFREYGLPERIRTDNGCPFASRGLAGLSRLSVWWLRLGIVPERIEPGKPQQNGRHERMHRTLKAETTRPAASTFLQQQERFDLFREEYNVERPHEALGQKPPATLYERSPRPFPEHLPEPEYPLHDYVTPVSSSGHVRLRGPGRHSGHVYVAQALAGELVGVREVEDGHWLLTFMTLDLGVIDWPARRFRPLALTATELPDDSERPDPGT